MTAAFQGILPALLTPFADNGRFIDTDSLSEHVHWLIGRGVSGFYVCGTTGEFPMLSLAERKQVAGIVTAEVKGRVPVIVHAGCMTTADTVALCRHAQEVGADAVAAVTPWYHPFDDAALYRHYAAVAEAVPDLPVLLYHIPSHGRNQIAPELLRRLASQYGNVIGLKDSGRDMDRTAEYVRAVPGGTVLVGAETHILPALSLGGSGAVLALANVFPEAALSVVKLFQAGDLAGARRLQAEVAALGAAVKGPGGLSLLRQALAFRGVPSGSPRAPGRPLETAEAEALRERLVGLGVL